MFDISKLTAYINDNNQQLFSKACLDFRSIGVKGIGSMRIEPDVKTTKRIHSLDQQIFIQPAAAGQFQSSGNTILAEVDLSTVKIMANSGLYIESLNDTFLQNSLRAGYNDTMPKNIENQYTQLLIDKIHEQFEYMVWSNSPATSVAPAGLIYQMSGDTKVNKINWKPDTGTTLSEWVARLGQLRSSLPNPIQREKDLVTFCSINQFYNFNTAAVIAGNYNIGENVLGKNLNNGLDPILIPGTNMHLVAVPGMPDGNLVSGLWSNFIYACDLENEPWKLTSWYSNDFREFRTSLYHKLGFFYLFPEYIAMTY